MISLQSISEFRHYLSDWEKIGGKVITDSTLTGLKAMLQATILLFEFLRENYKFQYLMTSRLNQNNLEVLFIF